MGEIKLSLSCMFIVDVSLQHACTSISTDKVALVTPSHHQLVLTRRGLM